MIVPRGIFGVALTNLVRIEHAQSGAFKPPDRVPSRDGMREVSSLSSSAEQQQLGRLPRVCNSGRYPPEAILLCFPVKMVEAELSLRCGISNIASIWRRHWERSNGNPNHHGPQWRYSA
jgi:hypothetical protein